MLPTLLIVEDEKATRDGLRSALDDDFEVFVASNIAEAMAVLSSQSIELLLTDLRLGGDSGMELLEKVNFLRDPPVTLIMTAYGSVSTAVEAMRRGAWHFVTKPLNLDEVELLLKRALKSRSLEKENIQLNQQVKKSRGLDHLVGKSSAMRKITELIEQVAPTRATILIEGESGTGKEVVANTIHQLSGRPASKLVVVNCAALSSQLLESELFGHEKGAFTGAAARRIGRFEQADGGTLFLDEIGEIDAATQVKLLRVLSERSIERVGANTPIKVDVRVISATNKNLKKMVENGTFREDLYFRLNVVKIDLPPLRERGEDLVLLANRFLKEFATENGKIQKPLSDEALTAVRSYSWRGNIRELRTAIEHGVVMSNSDEIELKHLPQFVTEDSLKKISSPSEHLNLDESADFNLHQLERKMIQSALAAAGENRTLAAEWLGLSRRTLQRKLKEYQIH